MVIESWVTGKTAVTKDLLCSGKFTSKHLMANNSNRALQSHFHGVMYPASVWLCQQKMCRAEQNICVLSVHHLVGYYCGMLWDTSSPALLHTQFFLQLFCLPAALVCTLMLHGLLASWWF